MPPPTFQELTHALAILAGAKAAAASEQNHSRTNQRSVSEPLPRKYRWRKLKIAYSEAVLKMYPYLADFDSDGYDDIEAGEEDNFVRWDPVNGVHVPRETPLVLTEQDKVEEGFIVAPGDNGPAQLLQGEVDLKTFLEADEELVAIPEKDVPLAQILGDQIGLSILLKAAKAVSENGQDEKTEFDDGDMPSPSEKHGDAIDNEASVISDLILTPQRLGPCFPVLPPVYIVSADSGHLSIDHEYPPTPRGEWDWQLQSEDDDVIKNQIIFFPADVQQMCEIRRGPDALFNAEATGAEPYPAGFQLAAVPDVPYLLLSHQYPEFRISDLSWPEGLPWSQVPTPQWELSPATPVPRSPKDGYFPLEHDCNLLPTGHDCPTPECEYDLQVQKEKGDLRKSQIDSPTIEAQQKRESRRRPIPLSQLFDDSDSEAESPSKIGLNPTKSPIDSPATATEVLRQSYSETITPLMKSEHETAEPKITEVEHLSEIDLHSDSVGVIDIIDTNKGQIHTHQIKTDSEIPFRPNHPHLTKDSNSLHPNKSEIFSNQSLGKLDGDQTGASLSNGSNRSECRGIALEDGEDNKEVRETDYVEEKTAEEAGVVDMEMGIEVDTLCQRQVSPPPVDTGFAMPTENCFTINREVVAISPRGQSVPRDEIIRTSSRSSKSPPWTLHPPSTNMAGSSTTVGESPKPVVLGHVMGGAGGHDESLDTSHGDSTSDLVLSSEPSEESTKYSRESTKYSRDSIDHSSFNRLHKSPGDEHLPHEPCETPADYSTPPRKHHENYFDNRDSSRKYYGDSTEAKRSSHKHHKHSGESKSHISHHNHRHNHHRRHHESKSPSRAPKRSRRHHGSHKRDGNRPRHEAKESSPDRGRRSERRQDSNVTGDYEKIPTGHKRLHHLSSSSLTRRPTPACQNKTSQSPPSGLQEIPSRKEVDRENKTSRHTTRERSASRKHHSHHRQKRHQKRHPSSDSDTSPVEHKANCRPLSASPTRQTNTASQQGKAPIGVRQRLQEGYGDPHAKLAAQGYFDQQGQLNSASHHHKFNNFNHSRGGFYGGYRARGSIYNRNIPGNGAVNVNGFSFIGDSNSLKWRKVDTA